MPPTPLLFADLETWGDRTAWIDAASGASQTFAELTRAADDLVRAHGRGPLLSFVEVQNDARSLTRLVGALRAGHAVYLAAPGDLERRPDLVERYDPHLLWHAEGAVTTRHARPLAMHPELAVLLSTSGSTGSPKLVRLSHANLSSNASAIAEYLGLADGERALTSLKPHYSYGLSVVLSHLLHGHTLVLTEASATEDAFWDAIRTHEVTSFAGVPFTFQTIAELGIDLGALPSLRYVTQAGGKLHADLVRAFAEQMGSRQRRFFVMYGQTEASPRISFLPPALAKERPTSIGIPIPGGTIELHDGDGRVIEEPDQQGVLVYRGPNVMLGYAESVQDLAAPSGPEVLRTGDLAIRDRDGLYFIVGRAARFIKPFGVRVNLDEVEQRLQPQAPGAVCGGTDERLVVVVPQSAGADASDLAAQLRSELKLPAFALHVAALPEVPRLANGKPDYPAIAALAAAAPPREALPIRFLRLFVEELADLLGLRQRAWATVSELYSVLIGVPVVLPTHTFADLGDSLSYVQVRIELEQLLGEVPAGWEKLTVAELEQRREGHAL